MILGLDVSTSTVGWCLLEGEKIKDIGFISLSKGKSLVEKAAIFEKNLSIIADLRNITHVFIEAPLQRFSPGRSSAGTLVKLASFNGVTQFVCYQKLGISPELLNVTSARKSIGIQTQTQKKAGIPVKEQVFGWVENKLQTIVWPEKVLKSGPRKGQSIRLPECFDMADAYVIAMAGDMSL